MICPEGQPILTAAAMRAAEHAAIAAGASVEALMARAGAEVAEVVRRLAAGVPVLILCGPGNNGGDGYVAASRLRAMGVSVRVAASAVPGTDAAKAARAKWGDAIEPLADAHPAAILVDALFGTGLKRALNDVTASDLSALANAARLTIAVDVPSGVSTDEGAPLGEMPCFDLTLALGALKPAHMLQPAARICGAVRILDIGIDVQSDVLVLARPDLPEPGPNSHKYSRGMVAIVGGAMPGAAELASRAALRSGAGYVLALGEGQSAPHAIVRKPWSSGALDEKRIGAVVIGPGLGRNAEARAKLDAALVTDHALVIDGDALGLLDLDALAKRQAPTILTPHAGEFDKLFGKGEGSKIDRTRAAARQANAIVVFKGADTVIAAPDGRVRIAPPSNPWLSTAGTGDVLAGTIGAQLAAGLDPLEAAAAGVWLHADAARRLGKAFIADDLAHALTAARAAL